MKQITQKDYKRIMILKGMVKQQNKHRKLKHRDNHKLNLVGITKW